MRLELPDKLGILFIPKRYKVMRGGRGSGKSWGIARALLVLGRSKKLRILCTREVQKSIKDSVHKLLRDQIDLLGLGGFYQVLDNEIRGDNGTEFLFSGLAGHTIDSIKSFEGCDIVWVEEAHGVSKKSWTVLIPTIRKEDSEIWVSYNPELDTDETHVRFLEEDEDTVIVEMNFMDNPWFSDVLEKERLKCLRDYPKDYPNIWLGKCKPAVMGAIYYDEVEAIVASKRICNVPYDPMLKVHVVFDLGWNDSMFITLVQKHASELRIIKSIEDSHKTLDHYSAHLKGMGLNWGSMWLPHDGRHKDYKSGKSAQEIMTSLGWKVRITPNMSVEDGIRLTRMALPRMYFDKANTERLIQCAKRYRRAVNQATQEAGTPFHDEWSHGADCLRYTAINAEYMTNEDWGDYEDEDDDGSHIGRSSIGGY